MSAESEPIVRLWGADGVVLMDVHAGIVQVQVAGQAWKSRVNFTVPIERLRRAVDALESHGRGAVDMAASSTGADPALG